MDPTRCYGCEDTINFMISMIIEEGECEPTMCGECGKVHQPEEAEKEVTK